MAVALPGRLAIDRQWRDRGSCLQKALGNALRDAREPSVIGVEAIVRKEYD
jgi:hypothetical protein